MICKYGPSLAVRHIVQTIPSLGCLILCVDWTKETDQSDVWLDAERFEDPGGIVLGCLRIVPGYMATA